MKPWEQPRRLEGPEREFALRGYLMLAGLFVASLVTCNLIFRKFFQWEILGLDFQQSVGLLPYPITFLVTDLISEIYGKKRANHVVLAGLLASVFVLLIITLAGLAEGASWSPVSNEQFDHVFGQTALAVGASMAAYLLAQSLDVQVFHFWKGLTQGKHLWLRNNLSTIPSQIIDTATVLGLLCAVGEIPWAQFGLLFLNGVGFKAIMALIDTPLVYLGVGFMRQRLGLAVGQEVEF